MIDPVARCARPAALALCVALVASSCASRGAPANATRAATSRVPTQTPAARPAPSVVPSDTSIPDSECAPLKVRLIDDPPGFAPVELDAPWSCFGAGRIAASNQQAARELVADGFIQAYEGTWLASEKDSIDVTLYQFTSDAGAATFASTTSHLAPRQAAKASTFTVPGVPIRSALVTSSSKGIGAEILIQRGPIVAQIAATGTSRSATVSRAVGIATQQYPLL